MQTTIRKRRCLKEFRIPRGIKIACFSLVITSCSIFKVEQDKSNDPFAKNLKQSQSYFCHKSSGRGRIVLGSETNRFTFQSKVEDNFFEIAIDIPFKGQETLRLPLVKPFKFQGSLYEKSTKEIEADVRAKNSKKILDAFLFRTAKYVSLLTGHVDSTQCAGEKCLDGILVIENDEVSYEAPLSKLFLFQAKAKKGAATYFGSMSFKAQNPDKASKSLLALDLIMDSCDGR